MTESVPPPSTIDALFHAVFPSFAMLAGIQLDVFTGLAQGPLQADELATQLGVDAERLERLLYALVDAQLVAVSEGRFSNSAEAQGYLVSSSPHYLGDCRALLDEFWRAALDTAESVRTGRPSKKHDYTTLPQAELETFYRGLDWEARAAGRDLPQRFDLSTRRSLLDVGGGSGGLSVEVVQACPRLCATVLELPSVMPITRRFVARSGLSDRIAVITSDIFERPPPGSYDVAVMRAFVQVLGSHQARRAIGNVACALEPGGVLYIIGAGVLDNSHVSPRTAIWWDLVFLNIYDEGRSRTEAEHESYLAEAGLAGVQRLPRGDGGSIFVAHKPPA